MKKTIFYYVIAVMVAFTACQKIDMESTPEVGKVNTLLTSDSVNYNVSIQTARYLASLTNPNITSVEPVVSPSKEVLMYFVNFKEGWMAIAADKRVDPILALSETGSLSVKEMDNPGVAVWFNDVADKLTALKKEGKSVKYDSEILNRWLLIEKAAYRTDANAIKYKTKSASKLKSGAIEEYGLFFARRLVSVSTAAAPVIRKEHLLQTKWGQDDPWNVNTPYALSDNTWVRSLTGCTAVAMSQILYYLHYRLNKPTGLYHTVSSTGYIYDSENYSVSFTRGDYVNPSPRWDQMARFYWNSNTSYVADLMADVGNRVGMKYGVLASSAYPSASAFSAYGITCQEAGYNSSNVLSELNNNIPVLVTAYATKYTTGWWLWETTHYKDGHAWVIDGYQKQGTRYTYTYVWDLLMYNPLDGSNPSNSYVESVTYNYGNSIGLYDTKTDATVYDYYSTYLLMNWGWNGYCDNAMFNIAPTSSDAPWDAGGYYFQYKHNMIWNFR